VKKKKKEDTSVQYPLPLTLAANSANLQLYLYFRDCSAQPFTDVHFLFQIISLYSIGGYTADDSGGLSGNGGINASGTDSSGTIAFRDTGVGESGAGSGSGSWYSNQFWNGNDGWYSGDSGGVGGFSGMGTTNTASHGRGEFESVALERRTISALILYIFDFQNRGAGFLYFCSVGVDSDDSNWGVSGYGVGSEGGDGGTIAVAGSGGMRGGRDADVGIGVGGRISV
jgi:hypothetical protein